MAKNKGRKDIEDTAPCAKEAAARVLFTSKDWDFVSIDSVRNTSTVELTHQQTGALAQLSLESKSGPDYRASYSYQQIFAADDPLSELIRAWWQAIRELFQNYGLPAPLPDLPGGDQPVPLSVRMDLNSDPKEGFFSGNGRIRLGDCLEAELALGGLHGSVEVTMRGEGLPLLLFSGGGDTAQAMKVSMVNLHRDRRDGGIEAITTFNDRQGRCISEGISLARVENPGAITIPLSFPSGTLSKVLMPDGNKALNQFGDFLLTQMTTSILAGTGGVLLAVNGKYKCLRSILTMFGACLLCTLGMLGASATGPGILAAAALCFGSKAIAIINLILGHMGFDP